MKIKNMITEDYVSYDIAILLKEKGFHEPCIATYNLLTKDFYIEETYQDWTSYWKNFISAPTYQMAMKWLRKVHKVNIEIHYNRFGENYKYLIIYKPVILDDIHSLGVYFHYEEVVEAALKYTLEKLI